MQSSNSLSGKVILITGASDGIGKATALECASKGATVIIHGKTQPKLELLYDEIVAAGYPEPVIYPLDLEKITPEDCETLNQVIYKEFGKLDGLFINAAWHGASTPMHQYDFQLWHRVMQINLNAAFMITSACTPLLNHEGGSNILFTLDDKDTAYWGAYSVSKAGLTSMMKILADELENTPVHVTGILPGVVHTAMRTRAFPGENPAKLTQPDEVAKAACFLLSADSKVVDGKSSHGRTFKLEELTDTLNV